ncbi:MAG: zinc ribbon domain-containing protein [Metallosphaera sp.]|uniref:zinc ribbon domain-containing protein n=1 Tax=Metallosphaera TaxID=41980 RepID=UPI001E33634C|nr:MULTISPECIES: zinc ribbon domain-containing protein [Metallosphaera]MCH1771464.1 zinc ribbon domain-containing protein [Metallosphaera sedula]MCP6728580.1 zinc ribbon domain-containing protein [Metallosphaera sedula]MCY0861414.1 zinc ribbon domain-containing protein [Metallosphaera prunae]WPX07158.1 zinc ribbon domain-containing protein [Metallosphaera sedula DSM 5348]
MDPAQSSTTCPRCGHAMKETGHRTLKCPQCSFEVHRDHVAVYKLCGRGSLSLSTAPQMRDVVPNR